MTDFTVAHEDVLRDRPPDYEGQRAFVEADGSWRVAHEGRWVAPVVTDPQGHPLTVPAQPSLLGSSVEEVARELLARNPEMQDDEARRVALQRMASSGNLDRLAQALREVREAYERMRHAMREMYGVLGTEYDDQMIRHVWGELREKARGTLAEWGDR